MDHYDPRLKLAKLSGKMEDKHSSEIHLRNYTKGQSEKITVRLVDDGWDEDRDIDKVEWCTPFAIDQLDDF